MPISETAEGLALRLLASYPSVPASKMAVVAISESLDRMGLDIAEAVIERARTEIVKVPSVAQLYEVAREIRAETHDREHRALTPAEFLAEMPPEVREKVAALHEKWDAETRRDPDAEDAEWERIKAATKARARMRGACSSSGKPAVLRNGEWVCPDCGVPIPKRVNA